MRLKGPGFGGVALAEGLENVPSDLRDVVLDSHFVSLADEVQRGALKSLLRRVDALPEPARSGLAREVNGYEGFGLGTILGFALTVAYDLGVSDYDLLSDIYESSLLGCLHAVLLDAVVDGRGSPDVAPTSTVYLAQVLFALYLDGLFRIARDVTPWPSFAAVGTQVYSSLYEEETRHRDQPMPYANSHILRDKCGEVKNLMAAVLTRVERQDLTATMATVIDHASFALCLLDDIFDWEQDLVERRYSYPVQKALDQAGLGNRPVVDPRELVPIVRRELFTTGIVHGLLAEIMDALERCQREIGPVSPRAELLLWQSGRHVRGYWSALISALAEV
jgi:hypothetical protein